ncbi:hypothetical protein LCGC14_0274620 [marine sediment metagenome]|uniref:Response regulatory domain-containing protein n=1 Tax=marine sediment metagenome TaxID=412755 RepID=A0A0F9U2S4_9ZZZZ|nr:response regulator [Phycisphaerae bacterium]HDZ43398.1 response regulator [Phycisphaerae bacterium]
MVMVLRHGNTILVAEPISDQAFFLESLLRSWGRDVCVVASVDEVLQIVRRQFVQQAVIATELVLAGQMLVARLAALPSLQRLIAVGPAGRPEIERQARLAGADVFLPRPVPVERLAQALDMPVPAEVVQEP